MPVKTAFGQKRTLPRSKKKEKKRRRTERIKSGSAQPQITRSGLSPYQIPIPPLGTQREIVTQLNAECALVDANRELEKLMKKRIEVALSRLWASGLTEPVRIAAE